MKFRKGIGDALEKTDVSIPDWLNSDNKQTDMELFADELVGFLDGLDEIPKSVFEVIDKYDDVFDNLFLYRTLKTLFYGIAETLFSIDDLLLIPNSEINKSSISMRIVSGSDISNSDENRILLTEKMSDFLFDYAGGMEFDIKVQDKFEEVFRKMLKAYDVNSDNYKSLLSELLGKLGVKSSRYFDCNLNKICGLKNEKLNELTLKYFVKGVNELLKCYGYREYTVNKTVTCINIADNELNKKYNIEEKIRIWEKKNCAISCENEREKEKENEQEKEQENEQEQENEYENEYEYEYEYWRELNIERECKRDINLINITGYDIIRIDLDIKRTTGIRELVIKGLSKVDSLDLPQKAGSSYFGELGSEAGSFVEKLLLNILDGYFVSKNDIPSNKMNYLLYSEKAENIKERYSDFGQEARIDKIKSNSKIKLKLNDKIEIDIFKLV